MVGIEADKAASLSIKSISAAPLTLVVVKLRFAKSLIPLVPLQSPEPIRIKYR